MESKSIEPDKRESEQLEESPEQRQLHVLIAEDDPVNSSIVKKRLEKFGYSVRMTGNGKECASVYNESRDSFDVILMDLQVWPYPHKQDTHMLILFCRCLLSMA